MTLNVSTYKSIRDDWVMELHFGQTSGVMHSASRNLSVPLWMMGYRGDSITRETMHGMGRYSIPGAGMNGGPRLGSLHFVAYGETPAKGEPPQLLTTLVSYISDLADVDGVLQFDKFTSDPLPFRLQS